MQINDILNLTALHIACYNKSSNGNARFVRSLLENGADLNKRDHFGRSPIHFTCISDNHEALLTIINFDQDKKRLKLNQ